MFRLMALLFILSNEVNISFSLREYEYKISQSLVLIIISIVYVGQLGTHLGFGFLKALSVIVSQNFW